MESINHKVKIKNHYDEAVEQGKIILRRKKAILPELDEVIKELHSWKHNLEIHNVGVNSAKVGSAVVAVAGFVSLFVPVPGARLVGGALLGLSTAGGAATNFGDFIANRIKGGIIERLFQPLQKKIQELNVDLQELQSHCEQLVAMTKVNFTHWLTRIMCTAAGVGAACFWWNEVRLAAKGSEALQIFNSVDGVIEVTNLGILMGAMVVGMSICDAILSIKNGNVLLRAINEKLPDLRTIQSELRKI